MKSLRSKVPFLSRNLKRTSNFIRSFHYEPVHALPSLPSPLEVSTEVASDLDSISSQTRKDFSGSLSLFLAVVEL